MPALRPIYIGKDEGVGSIISRIERTGDKRIALVIPHESTLFKNATEAEFLKEHLDKLERELILVTPDPQQEAMAKGIGFAVQSSLESDTAKDYLQTFYKEGESGGEAAPAPEAPAAPSTPETPSVPEQPTAAPAPEVPDLSAASPEPAASTPPTSEPPAIPEPPVAPPVPEIPDPAAAPTAPVPPTPVEAPAPAPEPISPEPPTAPTPVPDAPAPATSPVQGMDGVATPPQPEAPESVAGPAADALPDFSSGESFDPAGGSSDGAPSAFDGIEDLNLEAESPEEGSKSDEKPKKKKKGLFGLGGKKKDSKKDTPKTEESKEKSEASDDPESTKKEKKRAAIRRINLIITLILVIAIGAFLAAASFVFPRVTITVEPAKDLVLFEAKVTVDEDATEADLESMVLPGQIFEVESEKTQSFSATGQEERAEKANGTVTISNTFSSASQTLLATTRFESAEGVIFRIPEKVTIPGAKIEGGKITASSVDITVVADEAGEDFNIEPTTFTIPGFKGTDKFDGFQGESTEAFTGGAVGNVNVVTQEDFDTAQEMLQANILDEAQTELQSQIGSSFTIVDALIESEILEITTDKQVDEAGDSFEMTVRARAKAFAFTEDHLRQIILSNLSDRVSKVKQLQQDSLEITYSDAEKDFAQGTANFSVDSQAHVKFSVDVEKLKEAIAGKGTSEPELRKAITDFPEIATIHIDKWPFWISNVPTNTEKIEVEVSE